MAQLEGYGPAARGVRTEVVEGQRERWEDDGIIIVRVDEAKLDVSFVVRVHVDLAKAFVAPVLLGIACFVSAVDNPYLHVNLSTIGRADI